MYFEITQEDLREGHSSSTAPEWLKLSPSRAEIVGAPMGFPEIYLYHSEDLAIAASTPAAVLVRLAELGRSATISPFGMSQFLHHGLVPPPHTEWEEIWFIGMGERAILTDSPKGIDLAFERSYALVQANSTGESIPSTATLLELLTKSVDTQLAEADNQGFLMLSSGKDSVSVAVALAEGGHTDIPCITYRPAPENEEDVLAADVCRRLGLRHRTLDFPTDTSAVEKKLVAFFEGSPRPCADLVQIPYALAVVDSGLSSGAVLDGSGNDAYMGYVPGSGFRTKQRYRVRSQSAARLIDSIVPIDSPINYLTRSRLSSALPGRTLRFADTKKFYAESLDTEPWWHQISGQVAHMDDIDLMSAVEAVYEDQAAVHLKAYVAAAAFGLEAKLPYTDPEIVDYFFNLPTSSKFDPDSGESKILLREMLMDTIGYDAGKVGKHYFGFAGDQFLVEHRDFILSEISQCTLWEPNIASLAATWLDRVERRPLYYHSLLVLFQLSAWHNHSRYVR
jgi:hypothetical protein